jgi:hypothetical protein
MMEPDMEMMDPVKAIVGKTIFKGCVASELGWFNCKTKMVNHEAIVKDLAASPSLQG